MRKISKRVMLNLNSERIFEVIKSPLITEKATHEAFFNRYSFKVLFSATKDEIRMAVETLFKVKVQAVNTSCRVGKVKRFRGVKGRQNGYKKAVVRLVPGNVIDMGVKV